MSDRETSSAIAERGRDDEFERMTRIANSLIETWKRDRRCAEGYEPPAYVYLANAFLKYAPSSERGQAKWSHDKGPYDIRGCWECGALAGEGIHHIGCSRVQDPGPVMDDYKRHAAPPTTACRGFLPGADPSKCVWCGVKVERHPAPPSTLAGSGPSQDCIDAQEACIDLFDDYEWSELQNDPPSIRNAWKVGEALSRRSAMERIGG